MFTYAYQRSRRPRGDRGRAGRGRSPRRQSTDEPEAAQERIWTGDPEQEVMDEGRSKFSKFKDIPPSYEGQNKHFAGTAFVCHLELGGRPERHKSSKTRRNRRLGRLSHAQECRATFVYVWAWLRGGSGRPRQAPIRRQIRFYSFAQPD